MYELTVPLISMREITCKYKGHIPELIPELMPVINLPTINMLYEPAGLARPMSKERIFVYNYYLFIFSGKSNQTI